MNEIIQHYQENFNELPEIDLSKSETFINKANEIKNNLIQHPTSIREHHSRIDTFIKDLNKTISKDLLLAILSNIYNEIKIFTNIDLANSIQSGIQWISQMFLLNGTYQRWALLTENLYKQTSTYKSPEWIGAFAWPFMNIKDSKHNSLLPYCVSDINKHSIISEFYSSGIDYFVMFDDGAYSGEQKSTAIFIDAWNQLTKNPLKTDFTIIIIIPFLTRKAIEKFRITSIINNLGFDTETVNNPHNYCHWKDSKNNRNVFIWGGTFVMENTTDVVYKTVHEFIPNNVLCKKVYDFIIEKIILDDLEGVDVGAALCMFEHKIPDYLSFPVVIADVFYGNNYMREHYKLNPPYKYQKGLNNNNKLFECSRTNH